MGKFTVTHEIRCDVETFWKMFFDKDFNQALYIQCLGFPKFEVADQKETDSSLARTVKATPKMAKTTSFPRLCMNVPDFPRGLSPV